MDKVRVKIIADVSAVVDNKQRDFKAGEEVEIPENIATAMHRKGYVNMLDAAGHAAAAELPARKK